MSLALPTQDMKVKRKLLKPERVTVAKKVTVEAGRAGDVLIEIK